MSVAKVDCIPVMLTGDETALVDVWRMEHGGATREGAMRELVKLGLSVASRPAKPDLRLISGGRR